MASVIKRIAFQNFYNYYGSYDKNTFDLSEGVNIIVADNGAGKSKFFNGFLWLFYDEVLDSDSKTRKNINNQAVKVCSDKAKKEAQVNQDIECSVALEFSDSRFAYRISKGFKLRKLIENASTTDDSDWRVFFKELDVSKRDIVLKEYRQIYDEDEQRRIFSKLVHPNLREYSLFQGEEVDNIIDFNKADSINKAVRTLTNIGKYDTIEQLAKYIATRAERDLNQKVATNKSLASSYENKLQEKEKKVTSLDSEEKKLEAYENSYSESKAEVEKLETHNENAEARKKYDDKIKELQIELDKYKNEYENIVEKLNDRFFHGNFAWITLGCESIVERFKNKINDYRENRTIVKLEKLNKDNTNRINLLPPDSPDSVTLQTMIDKEHCYVCNREAKKGSDAWSYMKSLLYRPKNDAIDNKTIFKNDLNNFFGEIQIKAGPYVSRMENVQNSILATRKKEDELKNKINDINDKIKRIKEERSHLIIGDAEDTRNISKIMAQYKQALSRMQKSETDIVRTRAIIKDYRERIKKDEAELKRITPKDTPKEYIKHFELCSDIRDAAERTRKRVFDRMIDKLENEANRHFKNLIKYNDLSGGLLKFEKNLRGTIDFNYIDEDGNEVTGASEGFQRMKVLAVLMAIISVNPSGYQYPLIADAPLSAFGQGFIKGFFEETKDVFPQSIILIKDLYDRESTNKLNSLANDLIENRFVDTLYVNMIPNNIKPTEIQTENIKVM